MSVHMCECVYVRVSVCKRVYVRVRKRVSANAWFELRSKVENSFVGEIEVLESGT